MIVLFLVGALWRLHLGPFKNSEAALRPITSNGAAAPSGTGSSVGTGPATTTTVPLAISDYTVGDCVTWDQGETDSGNRQTRVVACDQPHLIEITGKINLPDHGSYPTDSQWTDVLSGGDCAKLAGAYVAGGLDPFGAFQVGAIKPLPGAWAVGNRTVWCGIEATIRVAADFPNHPEPFTGGVRTQSQALLWPTGSCLAGDTTASMVIGTVPCSQPHLYEIAGDVDAGAHFSDAPAHDSPLWGSQLGPACLTVARAAFGGQVPPGVDVFVFPIGPAGWRTGTHHTECGIDRLDAAGHPTPLAAPLLPAR
jgi:hypothetical protein